MKCPCCGQDIEYSSQLAERKKFIIIWNDLYQEKMTLKWKWYAKDIKLLSQDITKCSVQEGLLEGCMKRFFKDFIPAVTKFTEQAGYSYGVFHGSLEMILNFLRRK